MKQGPSACETMLTELLPLPPRVEFDSDEAGQICAKHGSTVGRIAWPATVGS
jgi:hypothetical protein